MKSQKGFTLIEIVMVLVLLGILSAVAVPKYFDLQESAQKNAAKAVAAEVQARYNALFAKNLLEGATATGKTACQAASDQALTDVQTGQDWGDWTVAFAVAADGKSALTIKRGKSAGDSVPGYTGMNLVLGDCGS